MHKHVEVILGRLATNPHLQRRFAERPEAVLREQALELTELEIAALAATDPGALRTFTAALDPRLRRASTEVDTRPGDGETSSGTVTGPEMETLS